MTEAESQLFAGIAPLNLAQMKTCFHISTRKYKAGEWVCSYGNGPWKIGLLTEGEAAIVRISADGTQTLMEQLLPGDVFGEIFFLHAGNLENYSVLAHKTCQIHFFDYRHVFTPCGKACEGHSHLIENVLLLMSQKATKLGERVEILSQRSIRGKLKSYFHIMSIRSGTDTFLLPFTLSTLADYLSIERSAMMRELKKLREEGLVDVQRRNVRVLVPEWLVSEE